MKNAALFLLTIAALAAEKPVKLTADQALQVREKQLAMSRVYATLAEAEANKAQAAETARQAREQLPLAQKALQEVVEKLRPKDCKECVLDDTLLEWRQPPVTPAKAEAKAQTKPEETTRTDK